MSDEHHSPMPEGAEPPPRGVRAMAIVRWAILALAALLAIASWWTFARENHGGSSTAIATKYHCPMHPQIVRDDPGECPICHMKLEPFTPEPTATRAVDAAVTLDGAAPLGVEPITLSIDRVQQIGVRTAVATERTASSSLRVTAVVAAADQAVAEVHVRASGFVEKIPVDQIGVHVAKGEELLAVYSPEVFQAESELLTARQWGDGGSRTADAARTKLELLGVDARDIDRVASSGVAMRAVPVYAPTSGIVTKKGVVRGAYVTPEMALYTIEDRSRVYIVADLFTQDVPFVHVGTTGRFTVRQRPDVAIAGRVDLIYPSVDPEARTTRVRITVANTKEQLRPGDYGDVDFDAKARKEVVVPRDAIVDTGDAKYLFVVDAPGHFVPRSIDLGGDLGDDVIVRSGVDAGERVVSGATFLIDSESRLRAAATPLEPK